MTRKQVAIQPQDDDQFLTVMRYLHDVEVTGMGKTDWATQEGIDPSTLWRWQKRWIKSGLLAACREFTSDVIFEDITIQRRRMARDFSKVLQEWMNLALYARREDVRLNAIHTMYSMIVKPMEDALIDPGTAEGDYLLVVTQNPEALDPMSVGRGYIPRPDRNAADPIPEDDDEPPSELDL